MLESAGRILEGHRTVARTAMPKASEDGSVPALARGAFTRAVLETLRDASRPLTATEAGREALTRLGLAADAMPRSMLSSRVGGIATTHVAKGTLRRIERGDEPYCLEVAR